LHYRAFKKDYAGIAKEQIIGSPAGFAKLLVEEGTDRILGFHMVGPQAADLVHEVVVAMSTRESTADLIRKTIHIHPTLPELIRQVFDAANS
jgi:mycothione reductase